MPAFPKPQYVRRHHHDRLRRPSASYSRFIHTIFARDRYTCRVPWCEQHRPVHCHHIVARSLGGRDEDSNCVTLCVWCHQLVEEGYIGIRTINGHLHFIRQRSWRKDLSTLSPHSRQ